MRVWAFPNIGEGMDMNSKRITFNFIADVCVKKVRNIYQIMKKHSHKASGAWINIKVMDNMHVDKMLTLYTCCHVYFCLLILEPPGLSR